MFGRNSRLRALELRKQLLIAESELNRAQMAGEVRALVAEARGLAHKTKSIGSVASTAAVLVAGLTAFQRSKPGNNGTKPTWLQSVIKGAGLVSTVWLALRKNRSDREDQPPPAIDRPH